MDWNAVIGTTLARVVTPPPAVALPSGRLVDLPGRGTTLVVDIPGPPGAPTLMLLHSLGCTANLTWFPSYDALSRHYRVVAFDQRWHGRGIRSPEFRLADCADDTAALADQLGIERFSAVGYSMGGAIAQLVWRRHRGRVEGLVLGGTSRNFTGRARERLTLGLMGATMARFSDRALGKMQARAARLPAEPESVPGHAMHVPSWALAEFRSTSVWSHVAVLAELGRFDSSAWIRRVDVPTSVVVASRDRMVPSHRQRRLAAAIPGAVQYDVDAGHAAVVLGAEHFVPALVEACRSVTRRAALRARRKGTGGEG